jgi:hypothetical protein
LSGLREDLAWARAGNGSGYLRETNHDQERGREECDLDWYIDDILMGFEHVGVGCTGHRELSQMLVTAELEQSIAQRERWWI